MKQIRLSRTKALLQFLGLFAAITLAVPINAQSESGAATDQGQAISSMPQVIDRAGLLGQMDELRQRNPRLYDRLRRGQQGSPNQAFGSSSTPINITPTHETVGDVVGQGVQEKTAPGIKSAPKGE